MYFETVMTLTMKSENTFQTYSVALTVPLTFNLKNKQVKFALAT